MSGNKAIVLVAAIALVMQSCFLFKEKPEGPKRPEKPEKPDTTEVHIDTTRIDTIQIGGPEKKERYRIAILLPFHLDDQFIFDYDMSDRAQYRPLIATELYEGMKLAMQELDSLGAPFTVNVYDTRSSEATIKRLLRKKEVQEADLVFGPLFPDLIKLASQGLDSSYTTIVSPFAGTVGIDTSDNRVFQVTPSLGAHMEQMAEYILNRYPTTTVLLVHPPDSNDAHMAKMWEEKFRQLNPRFSELLPVKRMELTYSGAILPSDLRLHDSTIVIVSSYNDIFFNNVARELYKLQEGRPVLLFSLPDIFKRLNTVRFDYLNSLHLHTSSSHMLDTSSGVYDSLRNRYTRTYGFPPPENVWIGYNQFLYFGYLLYEMGPTYKDVMGIGNLAPITETFDFQPVYKETADPFNPRVVHHYENRYVPILRYKNYELQEVRSRP